MKKIKELRAASYNPRKISEAQLTSLGKAMREFGDLSGIVVNRRTGNLVGGHQRIKCLDPSWDIVSTPHTDAVGTVALGHVETPHGRWTYREVDWTEKKEQAANVAANKQGGEWDMPALKDLLVDLDDGAFDLTVTGFSEQELKSMIDWASKQEARMGEEITIPETYQVVVTCASEADQLALLERLTAEGRSCRALLS